MWSRRITCRVAQLSKSAGRGRRTSSSQNTVRLLYSSNDNNSSAAPDSPEEYTNQGSIYNPPMHEIMATPIILESIRSALVGRDDRTKDTGMSLIFLGTSAGLPSKARSPTSTLLRLSGESILVDAGEGTQRQLMFTSAKLTKIDRILITHLHGDHIFGLPGLLLGLQHAYQLQDRTDRVVKIYGPPGLYNYIASSIIFSCTLFHSIQIEVTELVGGRVRRNHGNPREVRNPFEVNYPEFNFGKITRKLLPCGPDGVWTIEDLPPHLTRDDILSAKNSRGTNSGEKARCRIQAAEVDHLSGVVTFGYSIEEEEPPRNIDAVKAKELGVSPAGRKYNLLKAGFSVFTDDGSREVHPSDVLTGTRKRARKVTLVGDNRAWTAAMKGVARNSDVLVHEATLMEKDPDWRKRGHSTAKMAGRISGEVNAKLLVLNHISPKADYADQGGQLSLIQDAQRGTNGVSEVLVAYDFMEIVVPWLGFGPATSDEADAVVETTATDNEERRSQDKLVDTREVLQNWFGEKN